MRQIDVTVAICTWNRSTLLDRTLAAMCELRVPEGVRWEVLIANNACTDRTDEVVSRYTKSLPIRLIHEPTPGKSHAANRVVAEAEGGLILWTDDDVLVDPDWMIQYVKAAENLDFCYFGGTIDPLFAEPPPPWVAQNLDLLHIYAILQLDSATRPLEEDEYAYGANMAFRADVLRKFRFDPILGPNGNNQVRSEETELQKEMIAAGHRGLWVGPARVQHYIPPNRLGADFVRSWFRGGGRSVAIMEGPREVPHTFGYPRHAVRSYLELRARLLFSLHRKDRRWLKAFTRCAYLEGFLEEAKRLRLGSIGPGVPALDDSNQRKSPLSTTPAESQ